MSTALRMKNVKKDICNRIDIERLVAEFYTKVKADELLGPVFTEVVRINWEKHMPLMCDFWENAILFTGSYQGNPMDLHTHLHKAMPLQQLHFQKWNQLFINTVDHLFTGEKALLAKQRAIKISEVLQSKILDHK
ncbi:MAG: group III truncated hemoglobin [Bacteroidota bacterium]